jgi:phosphate starvation-inducible PhoH-like protein
VLTRQGFNSKLVVTGDVTQIDLPSGRGSGLIQAAEILKGIPEIRMVHFDQSDVVRHPMVQRIIQAYEAHQAAVEKQLSLRWNDGAQDSPDSTAKAGSH